MEWRFDSADQIYPSTMRQELMAALHRDGTPDSDFNSAELIYGELISNLIRYARGPVRVQLIWDGEFATLCVHDEELPASDGPDSSGEPPAHFDLPADPLAESGRGLYIVKTLAKEFELTHDGNDGSAARAILPVRRRVR